MGKETAIGKRVRMAMECFNRGDGSEAFLHASLAVAATARREYPRRKDNEAYKGFLHENMNIISFVSFDGWSVEGVRMPCNHPDIQKFAGGKPATLESILYHAVRCSLVHQGAWPSELRISPNQMGSDGTGATLIPCTLVLGMVVAVVVSGVNKAERLDAEISINVQKLEWKLNTIWGKKPMIHSEIIARAKQVRAEKT